MDFASATDMPQSRKHPPHHSPVGNRDRPIIIFLTVCTKDRKSVLANSGAHEAIIRSWANALSWQVGRYVVMPDHIHMFCAPSAIEAVPLQVWTTFWKRNVSMALGRTNSDPLWQRHFWDTQLRRGESYASKWEYVRNNPVRRGLALSPDDWPYQGELNVLDWAN